MANWLTRFFRDKPFEATEPRYVDVRKAKVRIRSHGNSYHEVEFFGAYLGIHPMSDIGEDWIYDASRRFSKWQERAGKTGMIDVGLMTGMGNEGKRHYIPLSHVHEIEVQYSEHMVEAKRTS